MLGTFIIVTIAAIVVKAVYGIKSVMVYVHVGGGLLCRMGFVATKKMLDFCITEAKAFC